MEQVMLSSYDFESEANLESSGDQPIPLLAILDCRKLYMSPQNQSVHKLLWLSLALKETLNVAMRDRTKDLLLRSVFLKD